MSIGPVEPGQKRLDIGILKICTSGKHWWPAKRDQHFAHNAIIVPTGFDHGWIVIDKPEGMTSARVVARVRAITKAAKAGHAGTLDPLATGVLPIALGEATKTVAWVMDGSKTYRFMVRWGEARDTDDTEGIVTETSEVRPSEAEIRAGLNGNICRCGTYDNIIQAALAVAQGG